MAAPCTSITDGRLDDLLEEIFVRLPTAADLVRASVAFHHVDSVRQLVTDRKFLRRFRKEHYPSFVGFFGWHSFCPALQPHTSTRIARAISRAADFNFSFLPRPNRYSMLPKPGHWGVRCIRGGRVLLDRGPKREKRSVVFPELVVCDPLHRLYRLLPPIPADLAAAVMDPLLLDYRRYCEVILLPPGKEVGEEMEEHDTSFRVIWMAQCKTKLVAFVYSSSSGQWQAIASKGWSDLLPGAPTMPSGYSPLFLSSQYAHGCLYWPMARRECGLANYPREVMLVLDTMGTMDFSVVDYPPGILRGQQIAIVEAGEGRPGLLAFSNGSSQLSFTVRQNSDQWLLEKIIPLGAKYGHRYIVGSTETYLLIWRSPADEGFSLDVKTFQIEMVCEIKDVATRPIYTSFPPSLAPRTV